MATNGNNNNALNVNAAGTGRKQQATIKIKESKIFMEKLNALSSTLFEGCGDIPDGLYLKLQNDLLQVYNTEICLEIQIAAAKKEKKTSKHKYTMEEKRAAFAAGNPHLTMCENCSRIVRKQFLNEHMKMNVCKDNRKIIDACLDTDGDELANEFNEDILCKYVGA